MLKRLHNCQRGSVAIIAAVTMTALMIGAGIAVDFGSLIRHRAELQAAADAAAIAGAREIPLAGSNVSLIEVVVDSYARTNLGFGLNSSSPSGSGATSSGSKRPAASSMTTATSDASGGGSSAGGGGTGSVTINTVVNVSDSTVEVQIEKAWTPYFAGFLNVSDVTINVTATAQLVGSGKVCVLGLSNSEPKTIFLDHDSMITAKDCGVISNSTDSDSIRADANGRIVARMICAAGGVNGPVSAFLPSATADCPAVVDPLKDRPEPTVGACTHNGLEIKDEMRVLAPGIYCDGLKISGTARVTFSPGVYVIKGAKFHVQDTAYIRGINVGFYLADDNTLFEFTEETSIDLTAPKDGPLAGILFFETRAASQGRKHRINSNDAKNLIGTIYLPQGSLQVDSKAPVASESAFTVIIANTIELLANPNLVLNSDYSLTDIPAPADITGGRVVLTE